MAQRTVFIRNQRGGMIWQIYHVSNFAEFDMLRKTALANGFGSITLEPFADSYDETFPNWRDSKAWQARWAAESPTYPTLGLQEFPS